MTDPKLEVATTYHAILLALSAMSRSRSSSGALASRGDRIATTTIATISMTTNVAIDNSSTRNEKGFGSGASVNCSGGGGANSNDPPRTAVTADPGGFLRDDTR